MGTIDGRLDGFDWWDRPGTVRTFTFGDWPTSPAGRTFELRTTFGEPIDCTVDAPDVTAEITVPALGVYTLVMVETTGASDVELFTIDLESTYRRRRRPLTADDLSVSIVEGDAAGVTVSIVGASGGGAVDSVNGETGEVVLDPDHLDDTSTTHKFASAAQLAKVDHLTVTQAVDLDAIETRVNGLDAAVVLRGAWDASAGTFPGGGTAQAGDSYIVSVAGTVDSVPFAIGDRIIAIIDNASTATYAANWLKADYSDLVSSVDGQTGAVDLSVTYAELTEAVLSEDVREIVASLTQAEIDAIPSPDPETLYIPTDGDDLLQAALDLLAPKANPTFTGNVVVPDADAATEAMNRQTADARYPQLTNGRLWLGPDRFLLQGGAPVMVGSGGTGSNPAVLYDAASQENTTVSFFPPVGWATVDIDLWWYNHGAGAGDVRWRMQLASHTDGSATVTTVADQSRNETAAAQNVITRRVAFIAGAAVDPTKLYRISLLRIAADAADTLANDAGLLGLMIRRAS